MPIAVPLSTADATRRAPGAAGLRRAAALITAGVAAVSVLSAGQPPARWVVLDNVRIIDGSGAEPTEQGRIVLEGSRIARLGPAAKIAAPAGAERLDLAGRTVIPGLIDL